MSPPASWERVIRPNSLVLAQLPSFNRSFVRADELPVAVALQQQTCAGVPAQNRTAFLLSALIALSIVFWIIVGLRFLVRWKITQKFWWDDWSMLVGVVSSKFHWNGQAYLTIVDRLLKLYLPFLTMSVSFQP